MLYTSEKVDFGKKLVLPIEKFPSLVLSRNNVTMPFHSIFVQLQYLSTGHLKEVKNKLKKILIF